MSAEKMSKDDYVSQLTVSGIQYNYYDIKKYLYAKGDLAELPRTLKILLEGVLRNFDGVLIGPQHLARFSAESRQERSGEIPFVPSRVVMQDFTGVPAVVDLAAMREAVRKRGLDPAMINPRVPVDLIVDHSVIVDDYGRPTSLKYNMDKEFQRNGERYRFLKWAVESLDNFRVVPPATGIIHQVNLEYLATIVTEDNGFLYPDTLVGTDSHTTMINGIGVAGWGVGGIEAEAGMLGQPIYMLMPEVVGVRLSGRLKEGVNATDLALKVTELLRRHNVVGKIVEFFGGGVEHLSLPDRATVSNMAPEYGATMGYFAADDVTLDYLRITGREEKQLQIIKTYLTAQGLYGTEENPAVYDQVIDLDLSELVSSVAGPKRPQDRHDLNKAGGAFAAELVKPAAQGGYGKSPDSASDGRGDGADILRHGSVVLAAITSCTNTSNPFVMLGAGLLAKNAVASGLRTPGYVKTSMAPGSQAVTGYLKSTGMLGALEQLGFYIAGYGCTTCIGNSGPLKSEIEEEIDRRDLVVASVLSGNRNFEGRIHSKVRANYLASPMLVVAYALAGRIDIDFETEPLGIGDSGLPLFLKDIWPGSAEIQSLITASVKKDIFTETYAVVFNNNPVWNSIKSSGSQCYPWEADSAYIREPGFFDNLERKDTVESVTGARVLLYLGDSITTDHISPAGSIGAESPAGKYLRAAGVEVKDFNSYGSRRGNHEVMVRGTFANIRIRNRMTDREGGYTVNRLTGKTEAVFDAAMAYRSAGVPLIVLAGKEYGAGSSRDWAAKGTSLLGVKAVIAESYERIHRSNLAGMGVLPLEFVQGESAGSLGLTGFETFYIQGLPKGFSPGEKVLVTAEEDGGKTTEFRVKVRLDSRAEIEYYLCGGILQKVLLEM